MQAEEAQVPCEEQKEKNSKKKKKKSKHDDADDIDQSTMNFYQEKGYVPPARYEERTHVFL